jgi:hypothetical protein
MSSWTLVNSAAIYISQAVSLNVFSPRTFESFTLSCADLRFDSTNGHGVMSWGSAGPPYAF